jgi:hypothetical protein
MAEILEANRRKGNPTKSNVPINSSDNLPKVEMFRFAKHEPQEFSAFVYVCASEFVTVLAARQGFSPSVTRLIQRALNCDPHNRLGFANLTHLRL